MLSVTELYGETNEKDSWGPRSLWPTLRFRANSLEESRTSAGSQIAAANHMDGFSVNQDLASQESLSGRRLKRSTPARKLLC
jgi:hypothetical protein